MKAIRRALAAPFLFLGLLLMPPRERDAALRMIDDGAEAMQERVRLYAITGIDPLAGRRPSRW